MQLCKQEHTITWKLVMVPRRSMEAAKAVTTVGLLQGVPKEPHHSWVLAIVMAS